jgi:hypothetical protein
MKEIIANRMLKLMNQIIREVNPPCRVVIDPSGREFRAAILKPEEKEINGVEPWVIIDLETVPTVEELVDDVVNQLVLAYEDKCSDCDRVPSYT